MTRALLPFRLPKKRTKMVRLEIPPFMKASEIGNKV